MGSLSFHHTVSIVLTCVEPERRKAGRDRADAEDSSPGAKVEQILANWIEPRGY